MWQKISQLILRNRLIITLFLLGMTIFLGANIFGKLKLDNKFGAMLPKDSPAQRDYLNFKERYGEDGGTFVGTSDSPSLVTRTVASSVDAGVVNSVVVPSAIIETVCTLPAGLVCASE